MVTNRVLGSRYLSAGLTAAALAMAALVLTTGADVAGAATPQTSALRSITITFSGDLIAHISINRNALQFGHGTSYDYRPMFREVQPLIASSDLTICSLEGPVAPSGVKYAGSPRFASPAAIASSIKDVGYDRCTIATNHSNDQGSAGIGATIDAFDAVGLGHSGSGRSPSDTVAEILDVKGVKVAHLAYTAGLSGWRALFTRTTTRVNMLSAARVIADATDARARGAEVVIVSLHWGVEYQRAITDSQARLARQITASGKVDLIAGSHAHVLQPIRQVNGKWVMFGLGNHLSSQNALTLGRPSTADGVLVTVRLNEQPGGGFEADRPVVTPTWVHHRQYYVMDVARHLADTTLPRDVRACLRAAWRRITTLYGDLVPALPA